MKLSLTKVNVLFACATVGGLKDITSRKSKVKDDAFEDLSHEGLIENDGNGWKTTKYGEALIELILTTKMPAQKTVWVDEHGKVIKGV